MAKNNEQKGTLWLDRYILTRRQFWTDQAEQLMIEFRELERKGKPEDPQVYLGILRQQSEARGALIELRNLQFCLIGDIKQNPV